MCMGHVCRSYDRLVRGHLRLSLRFLQLEGINVLNSLDWVEREHKNQVA